MLVRCLNSITDIEIESYKLFRKETKSSIFYDYNFLLALEEKPLLPQLKFYYLVAFEHDKIIGFLPIYLQVNVDPFGVLSDSLGYRFEKDTRALFSHVMHVSDSNLLTVKTNSSLIAQEIICELDRIAEENNVLSHGIINIARHNADKLQNYSSDWNCNFMWNRFSLDLQGITQVEEVIQNLSGRSRREVHRQMRIYSDSNGEINWLRVHDVNLAEVTALCEKTTIKNGTPHYYPPQAVTNLVMRCSDFTRIVEIRQNGLLAGVCIVFLDGEKMHLWAGGMDYDACDFSPYTLLYIDVYRYALENKILRIEAGRTNQKVKERLGFSPIPLYSLTKKGIKNV